MPQRQQRKYASLIDPDGDFNPVEAEEPESDFFADLMGFPAPKPALDISGPPDLPQMSPEPTDPRQTDLEGQIRSLDAPPPKPTLSQGLMGIGRGLNAWDRTPGQFQQQEFQREQAGLDQKNVKRQQLQQQLKDLLGQKQQGFENRIATGADARARASASHAAAMAPIERGLAQSQLDKANAPAPRKYGSRDVEREGKKFREYYDEQNPGIATDSIEIGTVPDADYEWVLRTGQPLQIKKGTAQSGDSPYSKPEQGPRPDRPDYEWVLRNGQPLQIQKGTAQPGDSPYDSVAARAANAGAQVSPYSKERTTRVLSDIEDARKLVGWSTTGMGAEALAALGGTDARQLAGKLRTLTSNIRLNELAQMKETSRTGASGLGQLSDREGKMLESALGAVDQGLEGEDLKEELDKIKGSIARWQKEMEKARTAASPVTPGQGQRGASGTPPPNAGPRTRIKL